jgi:hypothetical protein
MSRQAERMLWKAKSRQLPPAVAVALTRQPLCTRKLLSQQVRKESRCDIGPLIFPGGL